MSNSLSRRIMVVMTVAAVALGGIALPAAAKGGPKARNGETAEVSHRGKGKSDERKAAAKARKAEAKARREARFVAVGFVTAVDTAEVTLDVKGGRKSLRQLGTVTVTAAEGAKVKLNGERVTLDALAAGDHVMVKGAKVGDVYLANKVIASRGDDEEDDAAEDDAAEDDATEDDATEDDATGDDATTPTVDGTTDDATTDGDTTDGTTPAV